MYKLEITGLFDKKADVNSTLLKQFNITAINDSYPEPEYTDDSKIGIHSHAGGGDYCQ